MKSKRNLILTFDYELFLGSNSGSPLDCMIKPTDSILDTLNMFSLKAIFFVDTTYILRLREDSDKYPELVQHAKNIENQLTEILKQGHYVFPHLHPHWIDALYEPIKKTWRLTNYRYYRFNSLNIEQRNYIFDDSMTYIKRLYLDAQRNLEVFGYRAGGWAIQPFEDFEAYFQKHNIRHDFSVIPGFYNLDEQQYFDFRNIMKSSNYKFNAKNITIENIAGEYTEWPISVIPNRPITKIFNRMFNKYLWKIGEKSIGKGVGAKLNPVDKAVNGEMASIELLTRANINLYLKYLKVNSGIHFITHPKMVSHHNLRMFKKLMEKIHSLYIIESDFNLMAKNA